MTPFLRLAVNDVACTPGIINGAATAHTCACGTQQITRDPADRQNSVLVLTDSTQSRAAEYGYAPYGELYFFGYHKAGENAYRYHGAFIDLGTTGLYKMGARYYNESTGRFTQPDPSVQEFNRYNFTNSNPTTYSDPTGLGPWGCAGTWLLGVGVTLGLAAAAASGHAGWAAGALWGSAATTGLGTAFVAAETCGWTD